MAKREFKIGDKVRITGDYEDATNHLDGKVGTVLSARKDDIYVHVEGEKYNWLIWNHNAEHIIDPKCESDFKVGDRVRVDNLTGTVICISIGGLLGVQFDDEKYSGHRCGGVKLKVGKPSSKSNCWWVDPLNAHRIKAKVKPKCKKYRVDKRLVELIEQAKYCNSEELAEYLIAAGITLPKSNELDFDFSAED